MIPNRLQKIYVTILLGLSLFLSACNLPSETLETANQSLTQTFAAAATEIQATMDAAQETPITDTPIPPQEATSEVQPTEVPPTPVPPTPTIQHFTRPGDFPAGRQSGMTDPDSSSTAGENRASRGENFAVNLFERPFSATSMQYYPDLDITYTTFNQSGNWMYLEITTHDTRDGTLQGIYGIELDLDINGRGDILILAGNLQSEWSTDGVKVWKDSNYDVGDGVILASDPPQGGNGYDEMVFDQGLGNDPDLAWARVDPTDPKSAQIAFKKSLISYDNEFIWGAWVDKGVSTPAWYDYNDHFTHDEAGSPLVGLAQYPLKALAEVDNTCRWTFGFEPDGDEPGICAVPATPVPTATFTPTIQPGSITGIVFRDGNGNLVYNSGEVGIEGAGVRLRSGSCGSPGSVIATTSTGSDGRYGFSGIAPGTYCVDVPTDPATWTDKTGPTTVTVPAGGSMTVNFGYFYLG
jgi:hypothetical protein